MGITAEEETGYDVKVLMHALSHNRALQNIKDLQLILDVLLGQTIIEDQVVRHLLHLAQTISIDVQTALSGFSSDKQKFITNDN